MPEKTPSAPLPSATVMLIREDANAFEVFMVVRHQRIEFASGALVFPGGKVDDRDRDPALAPYIQGAKTEETARALQVAAIREVFEESGLLIARPQGEQVLVDGDRLKTLNHYRDDIHKSRIGLVEFLAKESLLLAADRLQPFAHWITPTMMSKRFDTWFYLVAAPPGQSAEHDRHESVDSVWITPQQAMLEARQGKRTILFPTMRNLAKLGQYQSIKEALGKTEQADLVTVEPWVEKRADGAWLCIPPEAGYDLAEEKMQERPATGKS